MAQSFPLFNKYLLSIYILGAMLNAEDMKISKTDI